MIVTSTRKDAEQGGDRASVLAPSTGLSSQGGTGQDQRQRAVWKREGKGESSASCAGPMRQAEIPGRSKDQEKEGFI